VQSHRYDLNPRQLGHSLSEVLNSLAGD